ncbi:MFS transporter [Psychrobacillus insolitus]
MLIYILHSQFFLNFRTIVGWIFIVYLVGTFSSTWFGSLSDRYGRQRILLVGIVLMLVGALITLNVSLIIQLIGITVFTFGFFGSNSIASGWVSQRAKHDKAQASSLYLFFYYFGSSIGGTAGGVFWSVFGWGGVVGLITALLIFAILLSFLLQYLIKRHE